MTQNQLARVLIVDGDPAVRALATILLAEEGIEVIEAADGAHALELLAGEVEVDALLLDIHVPGMDSRAFVREAREHGIHTPVIVLSHAYGPGTLAEELSAQGHLRKPFTPEDLIRVLRSTGE
ncbi:MAG: response regulator [Dehalococcoidia bacterium]